MLAGELIIPDIPVLSPEDSLQEAIDLFLDNKISHLPVVSEDLFVEGIMPVDIISEASDMGKTISFFKEDWLQVFSFKDMHALEVFHLLGKYELSVIPILDENRKYAGAISTQTLLYTLNNFYSFNEPGGIIVLNLGIKDYNLSEIARIVESNNSKILLLYMDVDPASAQIKLTIKINTLDLSHIIATFERFKYTVDFFHPSGESRDEMKDRYDFFMKIFDI